MTVVQRYLCSVLPVLYPCSPFSHLQHTLHVPKYTSTKLIRSQSTSKSVSPNPEIDLKVQQHQVSKLSISADMWFVALPILNIPAVEESLVLSTYRTATWRQQPFLTWWLDVFMLIMWKVVSGLGLALARVSPSFLNENRISCMWFGQIWYSLKVSQAVSTKRCTGYSSAREE